MSLVYGGLMFTDLSPVNGICARPLTESVLVQSF